MRDVPPERVHEVAEHLRADVREYTQGKRVFENFCGCVLDRADAERLRRRPSAESGTQ